MTSNGAQRADEESAAANTAASDDVGNNSDTQKEDTSSGEKAVEASPRDESSPAAEIQPAEASSAEVPAPLEALPLAEAAPAVETAPTPETAPATEAAPAAPATETAPTDAAPPDAASGAPPGPAEAEARSEEVSAAKAPASVPPARLESRAPLFSSVAPAIEITDEWSPRSTFWSTRPNRTWMLVGGSAIVIAFFVGALTGRMVEAERSREFVVPASLPGSPAPAAVSRPTASPAVPLLPSSAPPSAVLAPAKRAFPAFNAKAAKAAIDGIAPHLKACRYAGDPTGPASVMVTFAPAGRVSSASVKTTGYAGTRTENCIVQRLREVRIPEFTGAAVTVKRSVTIR